MQSRIVYMNILTKLQVVTLCLEAVICTTRVFSNQSLSILYQLSIVQPILMYLILFKKGNIIVCQIYILFAIGVTYLVVSRQLSQAYLSPLSALVNRLYWLELLFRLWSIHIGWRSFCASKVFVSEGVGDNANQEVESQLSIFT